jgi:hypothetical protein
MWAGNIVLVSTAVMLALPPAMAAGILPADTPLVLVRDPTRGIVSRNDSRNDTRPASAAVPVGIDGHADALAASQGAQGRADARRPTQDVLDGWHWTFDGQRPLIEYRLSESGVMRLRGMRGGAGVVFMWNY